MDGRLGTLLANLSEDEFITIGELALKLQLSQRTIRSLLSQLEQMLCGNGASIGRQRNKGVCLHITGRELYQEFCRKETPSSIPDSGEQRMEYVLALLFQTPDYIKTETLCDQLFVSRKTISIDLKSVEKFLNRHHISLERKPYYGLKMKGTEFAFRLCLSAIFYELRDVWFGKIYETFVDFEIIRKQVLDSIHKRGYTIYETDISNIVLQIQIALYRWNMGCKITMEEVDSKEWLQEGDIQVAQMCSLGLEHALGICFPVPEVKYIAIHLSGKKKLLAGENGNVVIDMEINQLVNEMLENVYQVFQLDFKSDFDLNTSLRQHMVSLRIRLQYHLKLENPMLKEIKEVYSFPYAVAAQAATVLSEYFHVIVSEDEIGYLALCFALSLERNKKKKKRNILLVCASGQGSARLFEYRFKELFEGYLNKVEICDIGSLPDKDFHDVDYVFSTVPITVPVPVPIYQVQYFFDRHNIRQVKRVLEDNQPDTIKQYFSEDLFFVDVEGDSREEVIREMCRRIGMVRQIPEEFEGSVLYRETIMQTDFCGQIAIPHPYKPLTDETFVCVAILNKPVRWYLCDVQVVFLLSISTQKENLEAFYMTAPQFMMDESCIRRLIRDKRYEILMDIIDTVESCQ
ncbi:BglG family transcription antiterminator [Lacrimispora sp.]|uniref:BglG family transcription antiterminator n=1 Tax=Lacrimispora sp. TaxID=2719234 RepID=UPI002FDAB08F